MPNSSRAFRECRRNRGRAPHFAAALAVAVAFSLTGTPAHALPAQESWFGWLSGPLARIVGLFAPEVGRNRSEVGAPTATTTSGPKGLFAQAGSYIDPNGKPVPPPNPVVSENLDQ